MNHGYKNKRRQSDLILKLLSWMNAIAVASLVVVLFLVAFAKPDLETFFDRYYDISLRTNWKSGFFIYIGFFLCLSLIASLVGLYLNSKRLKRKEDFIRATLIISLIISLIGIGLILNLSLNT